MFESSRVRVNECFYLRESIREGSRGMQKKFELMKVRVIMGDIGELFWDLFPRLLFSRDFREIESPFFWTTLGKIGDFGGSKLS